MSALVRTVRRLIMSGVPTKDAALKTALDSLDIVAGQEDPLAFLKLQRIIFNTGRDSESDLTAALTGLNITGIGTGETALPRIRNALLLSGDKDALRDALNDLLSSFAPPTDIAWAGVHTIAENAALGATVGGVLSATDPGGLSVTFSIPDASEKFNISGTNVVVAGVLDFETEPSHTITIRATNSESATYDEEFNITVTDVAEDPPDEPLPDGETDPDDPGNFDLPPYHVDVDGALKIGGKKKANGSSAKLIHDVQAALPIEAGTIYTMRYDPDFTQMSQDGVLAMVGFVLKTDNDFRMYGLRGDGSTGLDAYDVEGANLWTATTGFTESNEGDAANGTQAGPNWFQMEVSEDGTEVTIRTSDDGVVFDDEFVADVGPFDDVTDVTAWGPGVFFNSADDGPFSVAIDIWRSGVASLQNQFMIGADFPLSIHVSASRQYQIGGPVQINEV